MGTEEFLVCQCYMCAEEGNACVFAYPKYWYKALLTWNAINSGVDSLININVNPCILFAF